MSNLELDFPKSFRGQPGGKGQLENRECVEDSVTMDARRMLTLAGGGERHAWMRSVELAPSEQKWYHWC